MKLSLISLSSLVLAVPVLAAETGAPELESILVTGSRSLQTRAEVSGRLGLSVRETPATVDVLTQEDFQLQGIRSSIEAMNSAPGVASGNLPGSIGSVSMRGFHRAVNYLYDGVRMPNSDAGMRNWDAWSFERIEVIKGPASVTSGEGALAGAINFVPRRPHTEGLHGSLLASRGSFDSTRLAGDVNVPFNDEVALRATVSWADSAGWVDDTDSDSLALATSLLYRPGERFSLTLSVDYFEDNFSTAYFGTPIVSREVARQPSSVVSGSSGLVLDRAMRRVNFDLLDSEVGSEATWLRARMEYEISEGLRLVSDSSYYDSYRIWNDADEYSFNTGSGLIDRYTSIITHDHQFWSQRLHLALDSDLAGRRNRFSTGFEAGGTDFFTQRRFGSAPAADPFQPVRGRKQADNAENFDTRQDVDAEVEQLAFFAEDALNLNERWLLVASLRLDLIDLERQVRNVNTGTEQHYGQDYEPLSWRLGAVYEAARDTHFFAQHTRGATPVSGLLFMSAANAAFDLSDGTSTELGIRSALADQRVQLTASVFHIRQDDIITRDPQNPAVSVQGGSQAARGMELALDWAVNSSLRLNFSGSLLDSDYRRLIEAGGADRSGKRPPNVPERLADLSLYYRPATLPLTLSANLRHNGGFFTSSANTIKVNSFTTLDAAISWQMDGGTLTLRGRNLTDEFYADWSGYAAGLVFTGAPRNYELSYLWNF